MKDIIFMKNCVVDFECELVFRFILRLMQDHARVLFHATLAEEAGRYQGILVMSHWLSLSLILLKICMGI